MGIQDLIFPILVIVLAVLFFRSKGRKSESEERAVLSIRSKHRNTRSEARPALDDSIGQTEPICPYCNNSLSKMPGRKKKCPSCEQYIFVRTRPADKKRILIREDQKLDIEEQWAIANGRHDDFLAERKEWNDERDRLREKFGSEPRKADIEWGLLNKHLIESGDERDWSGYRNIRLAMGEQLEREGKASPAIDAYLEICFLDLNLPIYDDEIENDPDFAKFMEESFGPEEPPSTDDLASGIISRLWTLIDDERLDSRDIEARFLSISNRRKNWFPCKAPPEEAWVIVSDALFG